MIRLVLFVLISMMAAYPSALAGSNDGDPKCKGKDCEKPPIEKPPETPPCEKPPRQLCFNVVCQFEADVMDGYKKCDAVATFQKLVKWNGDELEDKSEDLWNPKFEVSCDGDVLFNSGAHRFTDLTGTRIQAEIGPYPALLLPRGALHDGHFYVPAALEFTQQTPRGYCFVYTGPQ